MGVRSKLCWVRAHVSPLWLSWMSSILDCAYIWSYSIHFRWIHLWFGFWLDRGEHLCRYFLRVHPCMWRWNFADFQLLHSPRWPKNRLWNLPKSNWRVKCNFLVNASVCLFTVNCFLQNYVLDKGRCWFDTQGWDGWIQPCHTCFRCPISCGGDDRLCFPTTLLDWILQP